MNVRQHRVYNLAMCRVGFPINRPRPTPYNPLSSSGVYATEAICLFGITNWGNDSANTAEKLVLGKRVTRDSANTAEKLVFGQTCDPPGGGGGGGGGLADPLGGTRPLDF